MSLEIEAGQTNFLMRGGLFELALLKHRKDGTLPSSYEYHEYPKMIRLNERVEEVVRMVETHDRRMIESREKVKKWDEIVVRDEAEEERVLAGGKSTQAIEEERQGLLNRARGLGILADPSWTAVRLRRELGEAMDAPPGDEMAGLQARLQRLEEMAAMKARIAELEAQVGASSEDPADLRSQLTALGVTVDKRWGTQRLRDELERATSPRAAA